MPAHLSEIELAAEAATLIGIIPLLWLAILAFRGRDLGAAWWWLAGAFAVSWLADNVARWANPFLVSPVYLVSQSSIIGLTLLSRREALLLIVVLTLTAVGAVLWRGVHSPDVLLHTVAWLSVVGILWQLKQLQRLRTALLVAFGGGWLFWMWYAIDPGWSSWIGYQLVRLTGVIWFGWAALRPMPQLKVIRPSL